VSICFAPLRPWRHCFCFICCLGVLSGGGFQFFAGRLRSELRQAIISYAEHDDSSGILLRVADTASKSLDEANSRTPGFFGVSIIPQCSIW